MTMLTSRVPRAVPRLGGVALAALALAAALLLLPSAVSAAEPHGGRGDRPAAGTGTPAPAPSDGGTTAAAAASGGAMVTTVALNLRGGPSTDSVVLTVMPAGSAVEIAGADQNGFVPVVYDGVSGYAYAEYLGDGADTAGGVDTGDAGAAGYTGSQAEIVAIIYAAADAYGQSREDMLRVATCESGLDPNNVTPPYDASGLFQFLPSTWASTPFADQSVFDPVANANAAAWMWSVGRRGEWVCQ